MKIIHVIIGLNRGGAENALMRLIETSIDSSQDIRVVSLTSLGPIGKLLIREGVIVYTLNLSSSGLNLPFVLWQLVRVFREFEPNIVQTWMYHADLLGGLAAYLAGCKNIIWGIRTLSLKNSSAATILIMHVCAFLSRYIPRRIICNAEASRTVHCALGYDNSRMIVVPNGFDAAKFIATEQEIDTFRVKVQLSKETLLIGSIGRYHADKGQDILVMAAKRVVQHHPEVKFLLVGQGCDFNNIDLMNRLEKSGMKDHFVLLGERNDIPTCLSAMSAFCMPSRTEAFPNGLAEAMLMALPCVATDVGDAAVLGGGTIHLVSPNDDRALAEGLLRILALSPMERSQMGQRAKERVMSEFTAEKVNGRYRDVYKQMLERP